MPKFGCGVVVQKEDFLRPDIGCNPQSWKNELRRRYSVLHNDLERFNLPGIAHELSVGGDPAFDALRCVGNFNSGKVSAFPRMHNKFLVFCTYGGKIIDAPILGAVEPLEIYPYAVWTGSFNFTLNATNSFENAVLIRNAEIATMYANEWAQIFALSEPLDWNSDWVAPEYRIGT